MRGNEFLDKMELVSPAYVESADKAPRFKRHTWVKYGLVAACLCAALLLSFLVMPNGNNAFMVKAYALDIAEDGTVQLTETDVLEHSKFWHAFYDGGTFYLNIGLKYDGKNIKSVTFSTENGFLAKQDLSKLRSDEYVYSRFGVSGIKFENCGNSITLDADSPNDELLLFWGTDDLDSLPESGPIEITATAVFNDGKTQKISIPINFEDSYYGMVIMYSGPINDDTKQMHDNLHDYFSDIFTKYNQEYFENQPTK